MTTQAKTTPKARSKERTKRVNPLGERQRLCAGCGLWKPTVDYNGPGASLCNHCIGWSATGASATVQRRIRKTVGRNPQRAAQGLSGKGSWIGFESLPFHRPGAMDAFALPSRMGNRLHYRDGRVMEIQ